MDGSYYKFSGNHKIVKDNAPPLHRPIATPSHRVFLGLLLVAVLHPPTHLLICDDSPVHEVVNCATVWACRVQVKPLRGRDRKGGGGEKEREYVR